MRGKSLRLSGRSIPADTPRLAAESTSFDKVDVGGTMLLRRVVVIRAQDELEGKQPLKSETYLIEG